MPHDPVPALTARPATPAPASRPFAPAAFAFSLALAATGAAGAADVILNEWNCVGSQKWLNNPGSASPGCPQPDGPQGSGCATEEDTFFGRVQGNGGDWIELVVVKDHMDLRGWRIQWQELGGGDANGQDVWVGDGSVPQGEIVFSASPVWADLRAGTILTITEHTTALGGLDTDLSFDPCNGDWWINVNVFDAALISANANVVDAANPTYDDPFDVGNDEWQARLVTPQGAVHVDLVGEGAAGWAGSGVNSREVVRLEENPSAAINAFSFWNDANSSSFGSPNGWTDNVTQCRKYQDFEALRASVRAELCDECHPVWLNEYNAVKADLFLNGGNAGADSAGGLASDSFFGRVAGNGGDWIELVVSEDHLDMRGWMIEWEEPLQAHAGTITLTTNAFWKDLRAGTILTLIQKTSAQGGLDTDLSLNPGAGDRWANVNTFDAALVAGTTSTTPGHISGNFTTSNDRWRMRIRDAGGSVVAPWAGEGSPWYHRGRVGNTEVCRLRQDATPGIDAASAYDDSSTASTFGSANTWTLCPGGQTATQSFASLPDAACVARAALPGDVNGDGRVDGADIGLLIGAWGSSNPAADLNGDGVVDGGDLGILLGGWTG